MEPERPIEKVWWHPNNLEVGMQHGLEIIVVGGRPRGIQLLQFANGTYEQGTGQLKQLSAYNWVVSSSGRALIKNPPS